VSALGKASAILKGQGWENTFTGAIQHPKIHSMDLPVHKSVYAHPDGRAMHLRMFYNDYDTVILETPEGPSMLHHTQLTRETLCPH